MVLTFSAKGEVVFDFLNEYLTKYTKGFSTEIVAKTYLKVSIEYFLQESKQIRIVSIDISLAGKEKNIPRFLQLPKEIQSKMVNHSISKSPIPFLKDITALDEEGGFYWSDSPEGLHFWEEVILKSNFAVFYEKYPLISRTDALTSIPMSKDVLIGCDYATGNVDENIIYEALNKYTHQFTKTLTKKEKENEKNQLQRKEVSQRREYTGTSRILRGTDKIRITVGHLGYQKVIVRS